ncbi:MAG: twin-arginine translocation signal domain-containing protein, partial [Gemmatimonadaceae bacterium]
MTGSRRSFLGVLSAMAGTAVLRPAEAQASASYSRRSLPPTEEWDLSWLDQLQGKHKQVFDLGVPQLD